MSDCSLIEVVYFQRCLAAPWLVPCETAAVSAHVLCTPYNHEQSHFIQSHTGRMHVYLIIICHLHLWQNDRDHLRTARGWNGYRNESAQKVDPGAKKNSTHSCPDSNPRPFDHESGAVPLSYLYPLPMIAVATIATRLQT